MDTSGIAKMLRSEQQLPSVLLETFYEPHYSMHESEVNEENKVLATHGNSALGGFGGKTSVMSLANHVYLDHVGRNKNNSFCYLLTSVALGYSTSGDEDEVTSFC